MEDIGLFCAQFFFLFGDLHALEAGIAHGPAFLGRYRIDADAVKIMRHLLHHLHDIGMHMGVFEQVILVAGLDQRGAPPLGRDMGQIIDGLVAQPREIGTGLRGDRHLRDAFGALKGLEIVQKAGNRILLPGLRCR